MARDLSRIVVVDVEATCWDGPPPKGQQNEIIEIGVCLLDVATLERTEKASLLVKPSRSEISPFCTELTTLTAADVGCGRTFAEACGELRDRYVAKERPWASFGDYDRRQFERQCAAFEVPYPFGPTHLNVKNLHALAAGLRHEVGLPDALAHWRLPLEGTHHRGHDDAWNVAAVLAQLLTRFRGAR
jgi:inhibitor of KinA sporulation pathway (predicted exonuclease)